MSTFQTERPLTAQRLAQYVARGRCERHMRFTLFPSEAKRQLTRFGLDFEPLSPLLSGEGQRFEREMVEELATLGVEVRDLTLVGRAIDASLGAGANVISSLFFYASNTDDARRSALATAVRDAMRRFPGRMPSPRWSLS